MCRLDMFGTYKKTFQLVKRWLMVHPYTLILTGTLLIAGGGVIATLGWNQKTVVSQKKQYYSVSGPRVENECKHYQGSQVRRN